MHERVSLAEADPELLRFIRDEERAAAQQVRLPVRTIAHSGPDIQSVLEHDGAFGAIVLDGLVAHEIELTGRLAVRLLGRGDLIMRRDGIRPLILAASHWRPASVLRVALFRGHMLLAMQRSPQLLMGMYLRLGQQLDRLDAQLMLCQLPRVEDRVLGLMWLLAESWGRVTTAGTRLSLDLTHEVIGMMIGARRPTVSLALSTLADRGAMVRQDDGWLLLGEASDLAGHHGSSGLDPRQPSAMLKLAVGPAVRGMVPGSPSYEVPDTAGSYAALQDAVARLREQHMRNVSMFDQRLRRLREVRERCQQTRSELARARRDRLRLVPS